MNRLKFYVGIWLGLIAGTVLEVAIRSLPGSDTAIVFAICLIAAVQAVVISLYYQNLRYEGISLATLPLAAVAGVVMLGVIAIMAVAMGG